MGYFWYGTRRHSVDRPPKSVQNLLQKGAAESHVDPDPQGTAESCRDIEPAPVPADESNGNPVEVSAESLSDTEDCNEDSQEIELKKIVKLTSNPRPRPDARYSLRRRVQPPSRLMCVNLCPSSGQASLKGVM